MKQYKINFAKSAVKSLDKIARTDQKRIITTIKSLESNPRQSGTIKLENKSNLYRIRVGQYRIIYDINDEEVIVLVVKIGHRRDIYRR